MTKVFVPNTVPTKELMTVIQTIGQAGYDKNQAFIGADFRQFAELLKKGDTAVVYSLTSFRSITEILSVTEELNKRGVALHSIQETWFQNPKIKPKELMSNLFLLAEQLHATPLDPSSASGSRRRTIRTNPKVLQIANRVALAQELIEKQQMPVVQACRTAGCSVSAYYTHKKTR